MRTPGTPDELERQRFRAVALLDAGHRPGEVARKLGVSPAAVSQWKRLYRQAGVDGLRSTPHPGPKPRLTPAQRRKLERLLLKGPLAHGYPTDVWTLNRVAEVIEKRFAIHYDRSSVWHVLKSVGWSCRKPDCRANECDNDDVIGWRRQQ